MSVLIRSNLSVPIGFNPSVYLQHNLLFALGFARAGTLAGTFYTLLGVLLGVLLCLCRLCLCLWVLLFLAWCVGSLTSRDCLRDLTFMRRIYNGEACC
jgi:hypothetical protein